MFGFINKKMFIGLLRFSGSLATKFVSLNNELCMVRSTLIDSNPVEFNCYSFLISLDKCSKTSNATDDLSKKYAFQVKQKT